MAAIIAERESSRKLLLLAKRYLGDHFQNLRFLTKRVAVTKSPTHFYFGRWQCISIQDQVRSYGRPFCLRCSVSFSTSATRCASSFREWHAGETAIPRGLDARRRSFVS